MKQRKVSSNAPQLLPSGIRPLHYTLWLKPDLERLKYDGEVEIALEFDEPTDTVLLNAVGLQVSQAGLTFNTHNTRTRFQAAELSMSDMHIWIKFEHTIPVSKATINIKFEGNISCMPVGFYRTDCTSDIDRHTYIWGTNLEPCFASYVFPCFDNPHLKATFTLSLQIPGALTALSNMPIDKMESHGDGCKTVTFETTPPMSTYVLAWAFGNFSRKVCEVKLENQQHPIPLAIYSIRGSEDSTEWALHYAKASFTFMSNDLGLRYSLPKLDFLIFPKESQISGLQNWGLIFVEEECFCDETSDDSHLGSVAVTVSHEIAHQWFGSSATPRWWNDHWLSEALATWVSMYTVEEQNPEYLVRETFASSLAGALRSDALPLAEPVDAPISHPLEIYGKLDCFYFKGSAILNMLSQWVGKEIFLSGISKYAKEFEHGVADSNDFYNTMGQVCREDIRSFMQSWISRPGYPLLSIVRDENSFYIHQSRFMFGVQDSEDGSPWPIIFEYKNRSGKQVIFLTEKTTIIQDEYISHGQDLGPYRVHCTPDVVETLDSKLEKVLSANTTIDLALAGVLSTEDLFRKIQNQATHANDSESWIIVFDMISLIRTIFDGNEPHCIGLDRFALKLVDKHDNSLKNITRMQEYLPNSYNSLWSSVFRYPKISFKTRMRLALRSLRCHRIQRFSSSLEVTPSSSSWPHINMLEHASELSELSGERLRQWQYMKEHWHEIRKKLPPYSVHEFLWTIIEHFSETTIAEDIDTFLEEVMEPFYARQLRNALGSIRIRADYRQRTEGDIEKYLISIGSIR